MDIYTVFFILSTFWVGPFWFAMLLNPQKEKTKKLLSGPLFFLGPIVIWILVMAMNPQGLVDFAKSGSHPDGFFAGLAVGMSALIGGLIGYFVLMGYVASGRPQAGLPLLNGGAILGYIIGGLIFVGSAAFSFGISL